MNTKENAQTNYGKSISRWSEYLCELGSEKEFKEILSESKNAMFATMKYRRELRSRGLGSPSFIELNTALMQNNYTRLHSLLQELFLEYLTQGQFQYVLDKINTTENGIEKLYNYHKYNIHFRAITVAMML